MIPIRDKKTDIASEVAQGKALQKKIIGLAEEAASRSIANGLDLNKVISEIAKRERFNRLQIQRLVEESNTIAYNKRYDKLRNSHDRRITFPIASLDGVVEEMGFSAPPPIENPNLPTGGAGEGEMNKAASVQIETSPIHNPHAKAKEYYDKQMEKKAAAEKQLSATQLAKQEKERNSTIFKIANSLVMSERMYKNANEIFNTLITDTSLEDETKNEIVKKASVIADHMVKTKRSHSGFMVTLSENPAEKVADHLLGEYSLLKQAEDSTKVKEIKVQPTVDVMDFQQLVNLARKLEAQQTVAKQPAPAASEVN